MFLEESRRVSQILNRVIKVGICLVGLMMDEKRYQRVRAIFVVIAILIIVVSGVALYPLHANHPIYTPPIYTIVNESFVVNADSYNAYNFTIPADISTCHVTGDFSVSPTNSSGFRVFIWDNAAFSNWQSRHSLPLGVGTISFYDSGFSTNGTISASPYPGGTYWLLFQNNSTASVNVTSIAGFWYISK
jgi:hypothetical protein